MAQESRLPANKLVPLLSLLKEWQGRSSESKRDLLSLIGHLSFAAMVVPPGGTFIRQLLDSSCTVSGLSASLTITNKAHCDIQWWLTFASTWNESPSSTTSSEPGHLTSTCTQMPPTLGLAAIPRLLVFGELACRVCAITHHGTGACANHSGMRPLGQEAAGSL